MAAQLCHLVGAGFGQHRHGRMFRIELPDQRGGLFDAGPDLAVIGKFCLDLVAEAPHQQGRVIAIAFDELLQAVHLRPHLRQVTVIEAAARMLQPETGNHLQAMFLGFVQHEAAFVAIGADGVGAQLLQQRKPRLPGGAMDGEGLAVDQDLATLHADFGGGNRRRSQQRTEDGRKAREVYVS